MELEGTLEELTVGELPDGLKLRMASATSGHGLIQNQESSFYDTPVERHRLEHFTAYSVVGRNETAIQRNMNDKFVFHSESGNNQNKVQGYLNNLSRGMGSWQAQKQSYEGSSPDFVYKFDNMFPERGRDEPLRPEEQKEIGIIAENYFDF